MVTRAARVRESAHGALASAAEAERRRSMLDMPHMAPLSAYVRALNARGLGTVPDFDPLDGGVQARLLLVLEKPAFRTPIFESPDAGFVSRDNDTGTARTIRLGMAQAGVPREGTAIWNAVPWWNGTMALRGAELRAGSAEFSTLLALFPDLRTIVLAGNAARQAAAMNTLPPGLRVWHCVHPSPQARAGPASAAAWRDLPHIWKAAWRDTEA